MSPVPMSKVIVAEDWVSAAADWIAQAVGQALEARGTCRAALCGGSTPAPVYRRLAGAALDWTRVAFFFGDERCVPPEDEDSNHRLVAEALADGARGVTLHRMEAEDPDLEAAARRYTMLLPRRLDLAVQGVGEDGHTASLFPGAPALAETRRRVLHVRGPEPPADRLTLTPPVLRGARASVVLARGLAKADVVRRALEGPFDPEALPVQLVRDGAWILDPAAASALSPETLEASA